MDGLSTALRYSGTVASLAMVPGAPPPVPTVPQTVPTCRLGFEGLCSVAPPQIALPTAWTLNPLILVYYTHFRSHSRGPERASFSTKVTQEPRSRGPEG